MTIRRVVPIMPAYGESGIHGRIHSGDCRAEMLEVWLSRGQTLCSLSIRDYSAIRRKLEMP